MIVTVAMLRAAGLTEAQIIKVLEAVEAERREKARIIKRNQRARPPDTQDTQDRQVRDTSFLPNKEKKEGRKKHLLAESWKPSDEDRAYARTKGWPDNRIEIEGERFRLYYVTKGTLIANEHLTWCKWVMSPIQNAGGQYGNGQGRRQGSILDAGDRLREKLRQAGASEDYVPGSSGPRPLQLDNELRAPSLRLIPKR